MLLTPSPVKQNRYHITLKLSRKNCSVHHQEMKTAVYNAGVAISLICLAAPPVFVSAQNEQLIAAIEAKAEAISALASQAQNAFYERCSDRNKCSGISSDPTVPCSVPACGSTFEEDKGFQCTSEWGSDAACGGPGISMVRSLNTSVVRLAAGTSFSSLETQAFVCSSTRLESSFSTGHNSGTLKAWQYTSDTSGSIRIWPGAPQDRGTKCDNYDARQRPWFVAASSGPKEIIIIFDTSGSMLTDTGFGTRHSAVQGALDALLGTLTTNDWVALIQFSDSATVVGGREQLQQATAEHVLDLQQKVKSISPFGGTAFHPPLAKAYELFEATTESTGCTKVILFLTDGETDDGDTALSFLGTQNMSVHIFTYAMGASATPDVPRAIACAKDGVFATIADGVDPLTEMQSYFRFLASGFQSDAVRWSTPYEDAFGLGRMVTGARAVYDRRDPSNPILVGVVGADVTIKELESHASYQAVIGQLIARSAVCPEPDFTPCRMQKLRDMEGSGSSVCPAPAPTVASCTGSSDVVIPTPCTDSSSNGGHDLNSVLCTMVDTNTLVAAAGASSTRDVACCTDDGVPVGNRTADPEESEAGSNTGLIIGVLFGVLFGVVIIAALVYFLCVKPAKDANKNTPAAAAPQQLAVPTAHAYGPPRPAHQHQAAHYGQPQTNYYV